jgi:hypothetical protein
VGAVEDEQGQRDAGELVTGNGEDLRQPQRPELADREDRTKRCPWSGRPRPRRTQS